MNQLVNNPFGQAQAEAGNPLIEAESHRQEAEIQAALVIAQRFPRNPITAMDKILQACTRPKLAESALYSFPRGGSMVTGPSVRLAESICQQWGNMQFGIRELSQANGESTVEAFAWDLETNTRSNKVFQVPHVRHTSSGSYKLKDPRDIYEMVANLGARRMRACILAVIPGDVVEAAAEQCEATQAATGGAPEEQIKNLSEAFGACGVGKDDLELFLGHRLDSVNGAEVARLRKVYTSIKDGVASPESFFKGVKAASQHAASQSAEDKIRAAAGINHDQSGRQKAFDESTDKANAKPAEPTDDKEEWPQRNGSGWADSRGLPFDARVHGMAASGVPSVNKHGAYRMRRGCDPTLHAKVEQDLIEEVHGSKEDAEPPAAEQAPHEQQPAQPVEPGPSASDIALAIRRCTSVDDCDDVEDMLRDSNINEGFESALSSELAERRKRIIGLDQG